MRSLCGMNLGSAQRERPAATTRGPFHAGGHEEHGDRPPRRPAAPLFMAALRSRTGLVPGRVHVPAGHAAVPFRNIRRPLCGTSQGEGPDAGFVPFRPVPLADGVKEP